MEDKNRPPKRSLLYNAVIILLVIMFLNAFVFPMFTQPRVTEVTYDKFLSMLDKGEVREVALDDTSSTILFLAEVEGAEGIYRTGAWPDDDLTQRLLSHPEVSFETEIIEETSPLERFLLGWILPYGIIFGAGYLLMRSLQKRMGGGNAMSFGKSNAKIVAENETGVTFKDVAEQLVEKKNDPIFQGTNGILTVGFIVVLLLCMVGFLIYWVLSIRSRALQFGIFRAMGMSMREILTMLINEHFYISALSIAVGVLVGEMTSRLYMPLIQMAYAASDSSLPLRVVSEAGDLGRILLIVGVLLAVCLAVLGTLISRMKIAQALKLGED